MCHEGFNSIVIEDRWKRPGEREIAPITMVISPTSRPDGNNRDLAGV